MAAVRPTSSRIWTALLAVGAAVFVGVIASVLISTVSRRSARAETGAADPRPAALTADAAGDLGRDVAARFGLPQRFELTLQVNNAFTAQNRRAIASAERLIAAVPGVRKVMGPAGLLAVSVDGAGKVSAGPMLAGGPDADASEEVRERLIRRSDAVGWFLSRDGTEIRLLIDGDNVPDIRPAIESAAASSGLVLLSGGAPASPLWPVPDRAPRPFPSWLPFALVGMAMLLPALLVAVGSRATPARAAVAAVAAGVAAAAPAMFAPATQLRLLALVAGLGAALLVLTLAAIARIARAVRGGPDLPSAGGRVPFLILVPSLGLLVAAGALLSQVSLGTQLWRETSVFFVHVRGNLDQPVVMRELRRLTDFLRAEPGVAHAWSVADLFFAVPVAGEEIGGIPAQAADLRSILMRARADSAVQLEITPDHREALVGVRWDDDSGVDRLAVLAALENYLGREHRSSLLPVDVSDGRLRPATRSIGKGILASDARERILRICARSGRNLSAAETRSIERGTLRAALLPIVDANKLRGELGGEVSAFLERVAIAQAHVVMPRPADRQRLSDQLFALPGDAMPAEMLDPLRALWGRQLAEPVLRSSAVEMHRGLSALRRRHAARLLFREVLFGADLPTEGVLSEEVRDATLEAMGPVVGLPVPFSAAHVWPVHAVAVGGAPNDRALSLAWLPRMKLGLAISAAITALLLVAVGGLAALGWWPAAFMLAAPLLLFPAVVDVPIGALYLAVLSGALAGGAAFAVAFAPGRAER